MAKRSNKTIETTVIAPVSKETAIAKQVDWDEELMQYAKRDVEQKITLSAGSFLSIRGGQFSLSGAKLKSPLNVVILAYAWENAYYPGKFDPNDIQSPQCFAIGEADKFADNDALLPHEDSGEKQSETCAACEQNQWGTADTGKGKACKNVMRLLLISGDDLSPRGLKAAQLTRFRVPVTSMTAVKNHIGGVRKQFGPIFSVQSIMTIDDDGDYVKVAFSVGEPLELSKDVQRALVGHLKAEEGSLMLPYKKNTEGALKAKATGPAKKRKF